MYTNPFYFQKPAQGQYAPVGNQSLANVQPKPDFSKIPSQEQFSVDPNSGSGGGAGTNIAGVAGAVTGAAGLATDAIDMANQRLNINTQTAPIQADQSMAPVYTAGRLVSDANNAKPKGASGGEILKGVGSGAAAGAAFGPWGAAIGAVVGGAVSAIGGGIRKKRQRREKNRAMGQANALGQAYNKADVNFRAKSAAMEDYNQRNSAESRLYSLYRSQY